MSFKKQVNSVRRKMTRQLTAGIGRSSDGQREGAIVPAEIKQILINRPNHRLGNLLLVTPLVQELELHFPGCRIDLFVKGGLAPVIFQNYGFVTGIIRLPKKPFSELIKYLKVWGRIKSKKYDLVINVDQGSSSGRISTKAARAKYKIFGDGNENLLAGLPGADHIAKRPVYQLRANIAGVDLNSPVPLLDLRLSKNELASGKQRLEELLPPGRKTISIFTYATGAKCYPEKWWSDFFQSLQHNFPAYQFVEILPAENVSQLNFSIPSFYSMDIREIASVIANTSLFIGADSGMMHLAVAALTPTIGLFNVTSMSVYEPYGNGSCGINTSESSLAEMIETVRRKLGGDQQVN